MKKTKEFVKIYVTYLIKNKYKKINFEKHYDVDSTEYKQHTLDLLELDKDIGLINFNLIQLVDNNSITNSKIIDIICNQVDYKSISTSQIDDCIFVMISNILYNSHNISEFEIEKDTKLKDLCIEIGLEYKKNEEEGDTDEVENILLNISKITTKCIYQESLEIITIADLISATRKSLDL